MKFKKIMINFAIKIISSFLISSAMKEFQELKILFEKREGLASCFSAIRKSKVNVDYVIVQKLDRFARDTILLGYLEFELKKCKCELLAVDQKFDNNPSGQLMKDIISAFAAFETL